MKTLRLQSMLRSCSLRATLLALAASAAATLASGSPGARPDPQDVARRVCVACHGPGGHAVSPMFPHLATQPAEYIAGELRAFRSHRRDDRAARDYMWGIAATLDDETIDALANYYAKQTPVTAPVETVKKADEGRQIFQAGDPARGIPACKSCHGEQGEGRGTFPRIAGQQGSYLQHELQALRSGTRPASVMQGVLTNMDDSQIESMAIFLSTQK